MAQVRAAAHAPGASPVRRDRSGRRAARSGCSVVNQSATPLPHVAGRVVAARSRSAGTSSTGAVPTKPSATRVVAGNVALPHVHAVLAAGFEVVPPGEDALPSSPPRAACSHSASVGSRLPAQRQYAVASFHDTWTTGWSSRARRCRRAVPRDAASRRRRPGATTAACATPRVSGKSSGSSPPNTNDQPKRSALGDVTGGVDEASGTRRWSPASGRWRTGRASPGAPGPRRRSG